MNLPIEVEGENGNGALTLVTGNVSMGGVSCFSQRPVPEMTRMQIRIELPSEGERRWINAEGIVVRVESPTASQNRYRLALLFTEMSSGDRETLQHYLEIHYSKA